MRFLKLFFLFVAISIHTFSDAQTKVVVLLDWFINPNHAPLFVAQQRGFFANQGLAVQLVGPANPNDPPKLVAAGKADIAITYQPLLLFQQQQGLGLVRFATLVNQPLNCLIARKDQGIQTLADLKGKRVATSGEDLSDSILQTMLARHGLTVKEIELINVHYNLSQALLAGQVDAAAGLMRNYEWLELQNYKIPIVAFFPEQHGFPSYDELILVARKDRLTDPTFVKFTHALQQGVRYLREHPEAMWQAFAKQYPEANNSLNHQAWLASVPLFAENPAYLDVKRYENFTKFLLAQHILKTAPKLSDYAISFTASS